MTSPQPASRGAETAGRREPVERFAPTSGRLVGHASLAVIVGLLLFLAVEVHSVTGLRLALGLALLGVLVWATQLRSRAALYPDVLHLKNAFRDATVPLTLIDGVVVRRTLNVWVGERRFVCVGIGTPLRKMVKAGSTGPSSLLGWDKLDSYTRSQTPLRPDQTVTDYGTFVENRITGLVDEARRAARPEARTASRPETSWAWPELSAVAVLSVAFVLSLLL